MWADYDLGSQRGRDSWEDGCIESFEADSRLGWRLWAPDVCLDPLRKRRKQEEI